MSQKINSNADRLEAVRLMLGGIASHKDELAASGITDEFVQKLSEQKLRVERTEAQQESLKAETKTCTAKLNQEMKKLMKLYFRARKIIKIDIPQPGWLAFGVAVKH